MNLRINEDPAASAPVRRLSEAYQATARSLERLASGQRVNILMDSDSGHAMCFGHTNVVTESGCKRLTRHPLELVVR